MKLEIKCLLREPYAGNPHVRFDEGEGGQRTGQKPENWLPLYSTVICGFLPIYPQMPQMGEDISYCETLRLPVRRTQTGLRERFFKSFHAKIAKEGRKNNPRMNADGVLVLRRLGNRKAWDYMRLRKARGVTTSIP